MLCREIIAVCSQIHTKHINTLCGQNVELLNVKLAVQTGTTQSVPTFRKSLYDSIPVKMPYQHLPHYQPVHRHKHTNVPRYCSVSP